MVSAQVKKTQQTVENDYWYVRVEDNTILHSFSQSEKQKCLKNKGRLYLTLWRATVTLWHLTFDPVTMMAPCPYILNGRPMNHEN